MSGLIVAESIADVNYMYL